MTLVQRLRLATAVRSRRPDKVARALAAGADPNESGSSGVTPLMVAAERGLLEVVEALAEAGAELEATDRNGSTPLAHAVAAGQLEAARALLERGADAGVVTGDGRRLTDLARELGDVAILKLLMAAAASRDPRA
jgi:ankyrin repeat protein